MLRKVLYTGAVIAGSTCFLFKKLQKNIPRVSESHRPASTPHHNYVNLNPLQKDEEFRIEPYAASFEVAISEGLKYEYDNMTRKRSIEYGDTPAYPNRDDMLAAKRQEGCKCG